MAANITDCVRLLLKSGEINQQQAETVLREEVQARSAADPGKTALENARATLTREKYLSVLQASLVNKLVDQAGSHPKGFARGAQSILARDVTGFAKWANVDQRRMAVMRSFTMQIGEAMDRLRPTAVGVRQDIGLMDDVIRELFGTATGNADAALFAKAFAHVFEEARLRFNAAGGDIPKRVGWGAPRSHDARQVKKAGLRVWKQFISARLDPQKIIGGDGLPLSPAELDKAIDEAYVTITTHALNKLTPGTVAGKNLANQRQDHRFFVFKDADSWIEYDKKFGGGNAFQSFIGHLENMAGDISLLEVMGPNPAHAMRVLRGHAQKNGVEGLSLAMTDALWRTVGGSSDAATLSLKTIDFFQAINQYITSTVLGSAILSSTSDFAFANQTALWNGLEAVRMMQNYMSLLNPTNAADRLKMVQIGLTADSWSSLATAANRYSEVTGRGLSARAADLTMRLQGLSHHTDVLQKAVGLEFMMKTADLTHLDWAAVPAPNRKLLEEAGFNAADWDMVRSTPKELHHGVERIDMENILNNQSIPLADRQRITGSLWQAIETLTHYAVPNPDARARAVRELAGPRGTIARIAADSVMQFTSFPTAVLLSHVYRIIYQGGITDKTAYAASLIVGTTVMGMLSIYAKDFRSGRTPRDMSPKFVMSAFFQGGGAGIFGDYVNTGLFGLNRFGGSFAGTLAGPGVRLASDIVKATAGQGGELIEGKKTNVATDLLTLASRNIPVVGSLFYTRLALDRLVLNRLQLQVDPDARQRWRQAERRRQKEYGQHSFWRPGEWSPESE